MSSAVPDGWATFAIRDVALDSDRYSFTGGPFGSNLKSEDYTDSGVRIIQLQNIGDGEFKNRYKIYTSEEKADELHSCNIYPNDIILSKMGDPVARATIMPSFDKRYLMASDGIRLAVDNSKFDTKFVHDTINSVPFRTQAELSSTGSTRKRIGLTELRQLTLISPPLPEQKKIASILSSVDDVITKTTAQIDKLKDLKTGMMQELLTKGVCDENGKRHTEFKDSPVGRIPVGWGVIPVGDVCTDVVDCVNKTAPIVDYPTPYKMIRTTNVRHGKVDTENVRYVSEDTYKIWNRRMLPADGDIIFTREAPVGECGILRKSKGIFLGQRTMMYRTDEQVIIPEFLLYSMQSHYCQSQIEDFSGGSTVAHMRVPDCGKILIKLPPISEQQDIINSISGVVNTTESKQRKLEKLTAIKKALMQDLLTGKVRVSVN
ncbi:MAG: restriction endonuclease subunit S [Endozoicomonadaceae bacterium]|nr:restriction endonuclease subunit S [Endozoicomonadaceae bacterium]